MRAQRRTQRMQGGLVVEIDNEWEMISFDAEGLDSSRLGLLKARIIDGTFKDINSIIVVKHGKILPIEYFLRYY